MPAKKKRKKPGPKEERLKVEGDWKEAAKKLVQPKDSEAEEEEPEEEPEE